jgi:hypothetical protein
MFPVMLNCFTFFKQVLRILLPRNDVKWFGGSASFRLKFFFSPTEMEMVNWYSYEALGHSTSERQVLDLEELQFRWPIPVFGHLNSALASEFFHILSLTLVSLNLLILKIPTRNLRYASYCFFVLLHTIELFKVDLNVHHRFGNVINVIKYYSLG